MGTKIVLVISAPDFADFTVFFVQELRPNGKWRKIPENAGPYNTSEEARAVAQAWSIEHHVKTRVIAEE